MGPTALPLPPPWVLPREVAEKNQFRHFLRCNLLQPAAALLPLRSLWMKVPLWQKLGHASYGEWLRASDKARRDAKKQASKAPAKVPRLLWSAPQVLSRSRSPSPSPEGFQEAYWLPGQLREEVLVTPRGRREHKLEHCSPGGTTRFDEYVSPAGLQDAVCDQRDACFRRMADARRATAVQRASLAAQRKRATDQAEQRTAPPRRRAEIASMLECQRFRLSRGPRCKCCTACEFAMMVCGGCMQGCYQEMSRAPEVCAIRQSMRAMPDCVPSGVALFCLQHAPCEEKLTRMGFRHSEFATVYEMLGSWVCD